MPCTECYGEPDLIYGCDDCGRPPRPELYRDRSIELTGRSPSPELLAYLHHCAKSGQRPEREGVLARLALGEVTP